jgi:hypothetical protein
VEHRHTELEDGRKRVPAAEILSAKTARAMCQNIDDDVFSPKYKQREEAASAYLGAEASRLVQGKLIATSGEEGVHKILCKILGEHGKLSNV